MKAVGIIPARYHSTRLEGKPLVDIHGRPMIQWVYENVMKAEVLDDVLVATDDQRIIEAVERFGGKAAMTSKDHTTGTDRIAEVAKHLDAQVVINVQGDEPFISPTMINEVATPLLADQDIPMCTLMHEITEEDFQNPKDFLLSITLLPLPCSLTINPSLISSSRAFRAVVLVIENCTHNSFSDGR